MNQLVTRERDEVCLVRDGRIWRDGEIVDCNELVFSFYASEVCRIVTWDLLVMGLGRFVLDRLLVKRRR